MISSLLFTWNHRLHLGGILPSSIVELPSELAPSDTLPASAVRAADINSPDGFNTNYTIIQQGFTANISCEKRDLNLDTIPPLVSSLTNQTLFNVPYFDLTITIQCPGANTTIFGRLVCVWMLPRFLKHFPLRFVQNLNSCKMATVERVQ